jgi:hypothetical protein
VSPVHGTRVDRGSAPSYQLQAGAGGIGAASSGTPRLVPVAGGDGISGVIDTAVSCGRTGGALGMSHIKCGWLHYG